VSQNKHFSGRVSRAELKRRRTDDDASDHRGQHLLQELVLDAAADAVEDLLRHADGQHDHEAEAAADHADHKARAHHPVLVALVLGPVYRQLYVGMRLPSRMRNITNCAGRRNIPQCRAG
jgi:hypothetical protein